jgi:hypothetical protein
LTKDSIISDIKLLLGADINKENVYVVVEGDDDIKFLRRYLNSNVTIYESFSGKNGVEEIVNSAIIFNSRVIGIRDKDYCNDFKNKKIFFYDRCCLEMMIAEVDEAFNGIYYEFYNGEMEPHKLKEHILNELFTVSQLRKYNEENKMEINFKGISFQSMIDDESKINEDKFIEQIKKLNSGKPINFIDIINKSSYQNTDNMLDITNGHDFILLFKAFCDKRCRGNSANEKQISSVLRGSFSEEFLKETTLYENISNYFDDKFKIWCC